MIVRLTSKERRYLVKNLDISVDNIGMERLVARIKDQQKYRMNSGNGLSGGSAKFKKFDDDVISWF